MREDGPLFLVVTLVETAADLSEFQTSRHHGTRIDRLAFHIGHHIPTLFSLLDDAGFTTLPMTLYTPCTAELEEHIAKKVETGESECDSEYDADVVLHQEGRVWGIPTDVNFAT